MAANAQRRRTNYASIVSELSDLVGARPVFPQCGRYSAPYAVPLLVTDADHAYARMRRAGLPVFRWDRLWYGTPVFNDDATQKWARGLVQVACHQSLRQGELTELCATLRAIVDEKHAFARGRVAELDASADCDGTSKHGT